MGKTIRLYHGTTTRRLHLILKSSRIKGWWTSQKTGNQSAMYWARARGIGTTSKGVIIRASIPKSLVSKSDRFKGFYFPTTDFGINRRHITGVWVYRGKPRLCWVFYKTLKDAMSDRNGVPSPL